MAPDEESISINGLKFKPYQMQCIEVLARREGYGDVKKWLNEKIISHILMPLLKGYSENFVREMLDKLEKDGYKDL
ncbi:MAG: hypothetical protein ACRD5J_15580 [Nitrososphaeraceae archaeon]